MQLIGWHRQERYALAVDRSRISLKMPGISSTARLFRVVALLRKTT
jgi:hypothetical protein